MFVSLAAPLSLLSFWLPLLFSVRAFHEQDSSANQFLLTYWLSYAIANNVCNFLQAHLVNLPLAGPLLLAAIMLNIWMFYGHGCLVAAHYYVPSMFRRITGYLSVAEFDQGFVSPVLLPMVNVVTESRPIRERLTPFLNTHQAGRAGYGGPSPDTARSILQVGVDRYCYMDEPAELYARYLKSQQFLWGVSLVLAPPKRAGRRRDHPKTAAGYGTCDNHHTKNTRDKLPLSKTRERERVSSSPVYGYVSLGDKWTTTTRLARSRSVSEGEMERKARKAQFGGAQQNGVFVPAMPPYRP